jgi:hypothetical protein
VLVFGGSRPPIASDNTADYVSTQPVQEFAPATSGDVIAGGQWLPEAPMNHPRVFLNTIALPTGNILIEGGVEKDTHHNTSGTFPCSGSPCPDLVPELYTVGLDPTISSGYSSMDLISSNTVSPTNTATPRAYHHIALLLPNGTVFVAGGDFRVTIPVTFPDAQYTGELYYPPYLFQGTRPVIRSYPTSASFSTSSSTQTLNISFVGYNQSVNRVVLTRPASVTHHWDFDQRYIELDPTTSFPSGYASGQSVNFSVNSPDQTLGPPGWYMLWIVEQKNTGELLPSDAKFIQLS